MATKKYRPSLTMTQIATILNLAKSQSPISPEALSIIATLAPFYTKVEVGSVAPAYIAKPAHSPISLLASLGGDSSTCTNESITNLSSSNAHYWEQCYNKLLEANNNPDIVLTNEELNAADEYKYLNNLMTSEELINFENGFNI